MIVGAGQPWAYDPAWLNREACTLTRIGGVLIALGCDTPMNAMPLPFYWWSLPDKIQLARQTHGLMGGPTCVWARSRPGRYTVLLVHMPTGQWWDYDDDARGRGIVALAQHRLELTPAKAAWRIARSMGFERPVPSGGEPE